MTGESVFLHYKLTEDFSKALSIEYREMYSNIAKILGNNEIMQVEVEYTEQYNKRYTGAMYFTKGYIGIADFMSIFECFSFSLLESNKVLYKEDMKQEYIKYVMYPLLKKKLKHFFVLEIPPIEK
jgi:hypothetical protein